MFARHFARRVPIALAGGCLLTATGSTVLLCQDSQVPSFELGGSRYDTTQYMGRVQQILEQIDPRTMFISDEEVKRCQKLLQKFEAQGKLPEGVDDEMMWEAQKNVKAVIHGPTGEKMFLPGRMSAFVPMNVPTCAGMLIHGPTSTAATVFWQWANQTYNIVNNYVNRVGPEVDTTGLLRSYVLAVTASVGIALAAGVFMKRRPGLTSKHACHVRSHIYIYIYVYIYVCVCVCVYIYFWSCLMAM